ncbi:hypothetical protein [Clostridium tyrobutyricum]|nr:hypothetical protein [Clostridium tyrobutyricum]
MDMPFRNAFYLCYTTIDARIKIIQVKLRKFLTSIRINIKDGGT